MAPSLVASGAMVTIYVSRKDKAMNLSKDVNGYMRVGGVDENPIVINGIDTVDVTNIDVDYLGHSYFGNSRLVLSDIYSIINGGLRPESRFSLRPVRFEKERKTYTYWIFGK